MKTYVVERMPSLFWKEIEDKGWKEHFCTEIVDKKDVEILIIRTKTVCNSEFMNQFPNVKLIIRSGTGYDNIDLVEAEKRDIIAVNTPEANATAAFEQTMSFLFAMLKRLPTQKKNVISKDWKEGLSYNWEFSDLKLLVVGYGRIGRKVANFAHNLGAEIKVVDPFKSDFEYEKVDYESGLSWCNAITFHCPLSQYTKHYFSEQSLELLKNPIWLINAARGSIIDEKAIKLGFEKHLLLGVALDVFADEPWNPLDFAEMENVILAPHTGAFTAAAKKRMAHETLSIWEKYALQDIAPKPIINYDLLKP